MKKTDLFDYRLASKALFFAITISSILSSCSEKKPLELKPSKTNIVNVTDFDDVFGPVRRSESISEFIEIIDGAYMMVPINDGNNWRIDVKVKSIKIADKDDEFEISNTGYTPGGTGLYLIDKAGTVIAEGGGSGQFDLTNKDVLKDYLYSGKGNCMLRFEIGGALEEFLKTPENIAGFIIRTSAYRKTAETEANQSIESSVSTSESVTSGSQDWDKLLSDYESYTDKYIALLTKAKNGDASAMTEYIDMLGKATELQESLMGSDGVMSPSQLQKFSKIQQKLLTAASSL
ncbi:MAG: hypothetical protein Q7U54_00515 [Bacteroidales bacterium]|nr:hypothetical protein [Bacteroidales bacterium]